MARRPEPAQKREHGFAGAQPCPGRPPHPTTHQTLEERKRQGWSSPIAPLEPGQLWCVFGQRGTWEWMVHPADADHYLTHGIVIDGTRYPVHVVGEWPLLNARQIRATDPAANTGFIEAVAA